jgi:bacillolysin
MKNKIGFINKIMAVFVVFSLSGQSVASAQTPQQQDKQRIGYNEATGKVSFIGADPSRPIAIRGAQTQGLQADSRALAMVSAYATDFGLRNPVSELKLLETEQVDGREVTRFQQVYQGIPIMGGEIIVNANDRAELLSLSGEISPDLALDVNPTVSAKQAQITALELMAKGLQVSMDGFEATTPELWIYDSRLFEPDGREAALVWRLEVKSMGDSLPVNELVLVDAKRGRILLNLNQIDTAWETTMNLDADHETRGWVHGSDVDGDQPLDEPNGSVSYSFTSAFTSSISTYTANNDTILPGTFLCDQTNPLCTGGVNPDADSAHLFASEVFDYYDTNHNRNSINNAGMTIISSVNYGSGYQNANWTGTQMLYGDGYSLADDVVGHELTHGVTQYESNLLYYYQSGAINESFSDVWGELYDQQNGLGDDSVGVKWLVGEDIPGGALRSMSNPPDYGDPDKMTSANYYTDPTDNGGVHTNSSINNKAVFLMVDGGSFNGETVTAIGANKTLAIYYEVQTNLLTSGADYSDLYNALYQGCLNLVGGAAGIVSGDCDQVRNATDAVEMNLQPVADFNPDAPFCSDGQAPTDNFYDDLESGTSNWTMINGTYTRWQYGFPYGDYAHSGTNLLYADDLPAVVTDAQLKLKSLTIPPNAYLHFSQAYDFEAYGVNYYDGGVLEYSTNNGVSWVDAKLLIDTNGYKGTIYPGWDNPLKGRSAFVGSSHGYISTRVNLSSLSGKNVNFRWRMGLDTSGYYWGWWLDDVRIYSCPETNPNVSVSIGEGGMGSYNIADQTARRFTYAGFSGGPVQVVNTESQPVVSSLRLLYNKKTFSELMGVPTSQLSNDYWLPYYANISGTDTQIRFTNTDPTLSTTVNVYLGDNPTPVYTNTLLPETTDRINLPLGTKGGPVRIVGTPGVDILAGMRVIYGGNKSFDELMAFPTAQLDTEYWFPFYNHNNVNLDTQVRVANTSSTTPAPVDIYIGDTLMDTTTIAPLSAYLKSFPGVNGGPVRVVSTSGTPVPIVASLRLLYNNKTFSELMGVPTSQLSNDYWLPYYANIPGTDTQLRFTNTDPTLSTTVNIYLGNNPTPVYTKTLLPKTADRINLPSGTTGGPVHIVGTGGVNILAGMRVIYGGNSSFDELSAYPDALLSAEYWFPFYNHNNVNLDTEARIGVP